MSTRASILILLLFLCQLLQAQHSSDRVDDDYRKFQETFITEIENDTLQLLEAVLHPASIPEILKDIPVDSKDKVYAVGISDPGMGMGKDAFLLALLRAKMITTLLLYPEVGILTDSYINDNSNKADSEFSTRYADFYNFKSALQFDSSSFIVEAYEMSSFGELVILLSYSKPETETDNLITAVADIYKNERQKQLTYDNEGKFGIETTETFNYASYSTSYQVSLLNNSAEIHTKMNQESYTFPYRNYRYVSNSDFETAENTGSKLTFGLWKSYSESLLTEMCRLSQDSDVEIKQLDDDYNSGKQSLSRELLKSQYRFQLVGVRIYNNCLTTRLKTLP